MGQLAHIDFMRHALLIGEKGAGKTAPSPSVGCVIVKNNIIIGEGFTQAGGRPHAEFMALEMAGDLAINADFYVTLEPCAHISHRGPSCTNLLLNAKPNCVFIAIEDPDPRTKGMGIKALIDAGIKVEIGLCFEEAKKAHFEFFDYIKKNGYL